MIKIRKGTFETNSSSTHSIAISKKKVDIPYGAFIEFNIGEYGWEFEEYGFPNYLYTSLLCCDDVEYLNKLKSILDKWGIRYKFQKPEWWYSSNGVRCLDNGYVDHSDETFDIMRKIIDDEDLLARALFGDATVYTGNDNSYEYGDMCLCSQEYVFNSDTQKFVSNSNHDSKHYDYFFKEN